MIFKTLKRLNTLKLNLNIVQFPTAFFFVKTNLETDNLPTLSWWDERYAFEQVHEKVNKVVESKM